MLIFLININLVIKHFSPSSSGILDIGFGYCSVQDNKHYNILEYQLNSILLPKIYVCKFIDNFNDIDIIQ